MQTIGIAQNVYGTPKTYIGYTVNSPYNLSLITPDQLIKDPTNIFNNLQNGTNSIIQNASVIGDMKNLANSINNLNGFLHLLTHPQELLKIFAQACIDLGFSAACIVSIVALCMYVFTGCKDKRPLTYVGLSVSIYYIIVVIFSAFVTLI